MGSFKIGMRILCVLSFNHSSISEAKSCIVELVISCIELLGAAEFGS